MEQSPVKKIEQGVSDAKNLRKRDPKLFWTLVVGGVLVLCIYVGYQFIIVRGLNSEISDLKGENARLKDESRDVKAERDSAKGRLASYEAIERKFPGETEAERQKLALAKLEEIVSTMQQVRDALPKPKRIEAEKAEKIAELLRNGPSFEVRLKYDSARRDEATLATQLRLVFEKCGWTVKDDSVPMTFWSVLPPPFVIKIAKPPPPSVQTALARILDGLGLEKGVGLDTSLPPNVIVIEIGPQ